MYLDSDEVIENSESLKNKISTFQQNEKIKAVISSGYKNPPGYGFINHYINEYGDPFSFFIYRQSKDASYFIKELKGSYPKVSENNQNIVFDFSNIRPLPIMELVAMGSILDLKYLRENFPDLNKNKYLIPHFFYLLTLNKCLVAINKNDTLLHYSSENLQRFLKKIA